MKIEPLHHAASLENRGIAVRIPVPNIAYHRAPDVRHVHADLVRAAGHERELQFAKIVSPPDNDIFRFRIQPLFAHSHLGAFVALKGLYQVRLHKPLLLGRRAVAHRQILLGKLVVTQKRVKLPHNGLVLGDKNDSRRVAVEAVNENGVGIRILLVLCEHVALDKVDERSVAVVAGAGVHHEARRLVAGDEAFVLEDYLEVPAEELGLGKPGKAFQVVVLSSGKLGFGHAQFQRVAFLQTVVLLDALAVYTRKPGADHAINVRQGAQGQALAQEAVETLVGVVKRDGNGDHDRRKIRWGELGGKERAKMKRVGRAQSPAQTASTLARSNLKKGVPFFVPGMEEL